MSSSLVIRTDANTRMGTGHVMRCIALGQAWQDAGGTVKFICAEIPDALAERVMAEGLDLIRINAEPGSPDDLHQTLEVVHYLSSVLWLVLDGYHFNLDYQHGIRAAGLKLLLVDDYNHLPEYEADILLNQNINAASLNCCINSDASMLLGTDYVLLRREFCNYCFPAQQQVPESAENILVTLGGGDPDNVTACIIDALNKLEIPQLHVKAVVGASNHNRDELDRLCRTSAYQMELLYVVSDMVSLFEWADLAVCAGGSTCWELCFMGVPALAVVIAENQIGIAEGLEHTGAVINLGWHGALEIENVRHELEQRILSESLRCAQILAEKDVVDGRGAERVVGTLR